MDGYEVMPIERAAEVGDIFCTATGDKNVIARAAIERLKDGAILANTGHFNVEIEIPALRELAVATREARPNVEEFELADGRRAVPDRRGPARQPRRRRGPSRLRHGHELCEPGALGRVRGRARGRARAPRLRRPRGDRSRDRPPEAREHGRRDRRAHRGAGEVPGVLGRREHRKCCAFSGDDLRPHEIVRLEGERGRPARPAAAPGRRSRTLECRSAAEVAEAIRTLAVRGAPAIGIAAAYGYALAAARGRGPRRGCGRRSSPRGHGREPPLGDRRDAAWATRAPPRSPRGPRALHDEEVERCRRMAAHAAGLLEPGHARAHALQRRRARDRRRRHRPRRLREGFERGLVAHVLRGRDAAAPPGRAADRVGARARRGPAHRRRRRGGRVADGARARSTPSSPAPTASRPTATRRTRSARTPLAVLAAHHGDPVLRRRAELDGRPRRRERRATSPSRSATRPR